MAANTGDYLMRQPRPSYARVNTAGARTAASNGRAHCQLTPNDARTVLLMSWELDDFREVVQWFLNECRTAHDQVPDDRSVTVQGAIRFLCRFAEDEERARG